MLKIENVEITGWEAAIRGMRNPKNSWEKSDSKYCSEYDHPPIEGSCKYCPYDNVCNKSETAMQQMYLVEDNDLKLMTTLRNAGTDHRKFMRMITVYLDITAPLYWWKEFDTYKVGTVANSCSTMHKIADKEFTLDDFSHEHLDSNYQDPKNKTIYYWYPKNSKIELNASPLDGLKLIIGLLNTNRMAFLETKDKEYWWQMIQLLPSSYNQRRTVMLNYEVLANIYKSRRNHKLDEWRVHDTPKEHEFRNKDFASGMWGFCDWIESLPYSELITGETQIRKVEGVNV